MTDADSALPQAAALAKLAHHRDDSASRALLHQRIKSQQADRDLADEEARLKAFIEDKKAQQSALCQALTRANTPCGPDALHAYQRELHALALRQESLESARDDALKNAKEARKLLERKRAEYQRAHAKADKLDQFHQSCQDAVTAADTRREEQESEETSTTSWSWQHRNQTAN